MDSDAFLATLDDRDLVRHYGAVIGALRDRGIVRSANHPHCDIAEVLVAEVLGGERMEPNAPYDVSAMGEKVQVKALRRTPSYTGQCTIDRRQDFDRLVAVVFTMDMDVEDIVSLPLEVFMEYAYRNEYQGKGGRSLVLTKKLLADDRVEHLAPPPGWAAPSSVMP